MHGGAPGSGGPKGPHNGNYKPRYTAEAIASGRWLRQFTRDVRARSVTDDIDVPETEAPGTGFAKAGGERSVVE
jgi:hypothetical protein